MILAWWTTAALAASPTWVEVGGNARVEFVDFALGSAPDLAPGATCHAMVSVAADATEVGEVPWDADRRIPRDCDAAVLAAVQAVSGGWRLQLKAWTAGAVAPLPMTFVVADDGTLRAELRAAAYGVADTGHPEALAIVEDARLVKAPEPRFPKAARKLVARGELADTATCRMTLSVDTHGRVGEARVDDCPAPLREAVEALGQAYRFAPKKVNGAAVAATLPVAVVMRAP